MSTGEREPKVARGGLFAAWPASLERGAVELAHEARVMRP